MAKTPSPPGGATDGVEPFAGIQEAGFRFLRELGKNNTRDWFHQHKTTYQSHVREPFALFLEELSETLQARAIKMWGGPQTMFRVQRDIRFSKDKTPYQTHVSGLLTPTGDKEETGPIVYAHCDAKGGFCASGMYNLPTPRLRVLRQRVVDKPSEAKKMVAALEKQGLKLDPSGSLKRAPKGFESYADHELGDLIRLKHWIVREDLKKADWKSGAVMGVLTDFIERSSPLLEFGRKALKRA
ncbi:MAG: TIGR02453 family protein [Planctomycetota bacterium]